MHWHVPNACKTYPGKIPGISQSVNDHFLQQLGECPELLEDTSCEPMCTGRYWRELDTSQQIVTTGFNSGARDSHTRE